MIAERRELKKKIDGLVIVALLCRRRLRSINHPYFIFPSFVVRILFGNAFDEAILFLGFLEFSCHFFPFQAYCRTYISLLEIPNFLYVTGFRHTDTWDFYISRNAFAGNYDK